MSSTTTRASTRTAGVHGRSGQRFVRRVGSLLVLGVVMFVIAACGGSSASSPTSTGSDTAADTVAEDTADDSAATENTADDSAPDDGVEAAPAATAIPDPTATPEPEPTATPEPEPTATTEPAPDTSKLDQLSAEKEALILGDRAADLTPEEQACVLAGVADDPAMLARIIEGPDVTELTPDELVSIAMVSWECAPDAVSAEFASDFEGGAGDDLPPGSSECIQESMAPGAENNRLVMLGFISLGLEQPAPAEAIQPVVDTLVECIPGSALVDELVQSEMDDPTFAAATDVDCLLARFDNEVMTVFWEGVVVSGGSFGDPSGEAEALLLDSLFSCVSMGRLIAAEAAADGVELSEATVACIDEELGDFSLAEAMAADDGSAIELAMFGCMTPEEMAAAGAS